jgi:hypothetical protein
MIPARNRLHSTRELQKKMMKPPLLIQASCPVQPSTLLGPDQVNLLSLLLSGLSDFLMGMDLAKTTFVLVNAGQRMSGNTTDLWETVDTRGRAYGRH